MLLDVCCTDAVILYSCIAAEWGSNCGFLFAESGSEAKTWWQNGHPCRRTKCNAGTLIAVYQDLLTVHTFVASDHVLPFARVCTQMQMFEVMMTQPWPAVCCSASRQVPCMVN